MVGQSFFGHAVLCFEDDGSVSLEAGNCPCREDDSRSLSLRDPDQRVDGGLCHDIPLLTDTNLVVHRRPSVSPAPGAAGHARAPDRMLPNDLAASSFSALAPQILSSTVHPSIRSTILRI
jgi:hypothetical protein